MSERTTHPVLREVASAAAPQPPPPASLAPAVTPQVDEKPPPSTAAADVGEETARYRRRVLLTLSLIVLALFLYWASAYFFAYTDDAYVTSDFVNVAPYVSGRIVSVNIVDNQAVTKGMVLAEIDPTPFRLALNEKQAKKIEAEAQLAVDRDVIAATQAQRDDAAAKERLASDNLRACDTGRRGRLCVAPGARHRDCAGAGGQGGFGRCCDRHRQGAADAGVAPGGGHDDFCRDCRRPVAARADKAAGADRRHDHSILCCGSAIRRSRTRR